MGGMLADVLVKCRSFSVRWSVYHFVLVCLHPCSFAVRKSNPYSYKQKVLEKNGTVSSTAEACFARELSLSSS